MLEMGDETISYFSLWISIRFEYRAD
jgi:hypothetical protein